MHLFLNLMLYDNLLILLLPVLSLLVVIRLLLKRISPPKKHIDQDGNEEKAQMQLNSPLTNEGFEHQDDKSVFERKDKVRIKTENYREREASLNVLRDRLEQVKKHPLEAPPTEQSHLISKISVPDTAVYYNLIQKRAHKRTQAHKRRIEEKEKLIKWLHTNIDNRLVEIKARRVAEEKARIAREQQQRKLETQRNLIAKATEHLEEYRFSKAISLYEKAYEIIPNESVNLILRKLKSDYFHFESHLESAKLQESIGKREQAIGSYEKALNIFPDHPSTKKRLLALQSQVRHFQEKQEQYKKKQQKRQEALEAEQIKIEKGDTALKSGNFKLALDYYRSVDKEAAYNPNLRHKIDKCLEGITRQQEANRLKEKRFDDHKIGADKLQSHGKYQEAIAKLEEAQTLFPQRAEELNKLKTLYQNKQKKKREQERLEQLATEKKVNWDEFQAFLRSKGISCFYHFTDRSNLPSIRQRGGLFSWAYCKKQGWQINRPGGSSESRGLDMAAGKQDFVRLSYNKEHPMLFIAKKEGRIEDPVYLVIDVEVAYLKNTEFSDKNAAARTKYQPKIGRSLEHLGNTRFDILEKAKRMKHYNLEDQEKPYNQAEVLVKAWVPARYIKNLNTL